VLDDNTDLHLLGSQVENSVFYNEEAEEKKAAEDAEFFNTQEYIDLLESTI
jgi:hypothetical protein